jgi:hypothetical protein
MQSWTYPRDRSARLAISTALVLLATSTAVPATAQPRGTGEELPAEILAVRVRQQGHRCDEPATAQSDAARSRPDERAWVVKCANASYRVRFVPHTAAMIEVLE